MSLPIYQDPNKNMMLMQTQWASQINPVITSEINNGHLLKSVPLVIGNNVINHLLGKNQQGWIITDINGVSAIYRAAPLNDKTLTLNSSAIVTISLYVF